MYITAEELLAGSSINYDFVIPVDLYKPFNVSDNQNPEADDPKTSSVKLKPLTIKDMQLIVKGAKNDATLTCSLMIHRSVVSPSMDIDTISRLNGGIVKFLIQKINQISGFTATEDHLSSMVQAPLARACFILAKEFGWTPEQVSEMTIGQILLYIEMIRKEA